MSVIFLFFNRTAFTANSSDRFISLDAPLPIVSGFSCQRRSSEGNLFNGLRSGEQLPGIRNLAEKLVMNPNTVAKVYRELEFEGLLEIRHGTGAFVTERGIDKLRLNNLRAAQPLVKQCVGKLLKQGLGKDEIRRLLEAELTRKEDLVRNQK